VAETYLLGGRLPLLAPGDLSDGRQKEFYQRMRTHQVPWADRHNFKGMTGDDKLIGPFNPLLYSPEGGTGFLDFEAAEERSSSLDDVHGHGKVPACGQVEVLAGGQLKVPIPRSPCRPGV
jgi:hypothetical protein